MLQSRTRPFSFFLLFLSFYYFSSGSFTTIMLVIARAQSGAVKQLRSKPGVRPLPRQRVLSLRALKAKAVLLSELLGH